MRSVQVLRAAGRRIDAIYQYTAQRWGEEEADAYIRQLFEYFQQIASEQVTWRPIPAVLGFNGFHGRCHQHFVYWKLLEDGSVGIVTVLHERMHQLEQFRQDNP